MILLTTIKVEGNSITGETTEYREPAYLFDNMELAEAFVISCRGPAVRGITPPNFKAGSPLQFCDDVELTDLDQLSHNPTYVSTKK